MAKYLHYYESESDFQKDYNGSGVTAFTISSVGATVLTACMEYEEAVQNPFGGRRFVFDRLMKSATAVSCESGLEDETDIMVFKNGNDEVLSIYFNADGWSHEAGTVFYIQDLSSVYQAGDYILGVTSPEYGSADYIEPWVSYTEGRRKVIKGHFQGMGHVFDTHVEGEFELRETGDKDIDFACECM